MANYEDAYIRITSNNGNSIEMGLKSARTNYKTTDDGKQVQKYQAFLSEWSGFYSGPSTDLEVEKRPFENGSIVSDYTLNGREVNLIFGVIGADNTDTVGTTSEVMINFHGSLKFEFFLGDIYRWFPCKVSSDGIEAELIGKYENNKGFVFSLTLVSEDSYKRGKPIFLEMNSVDTKEGGLLFPILGTYEEDTSKTLKFTGTSEHTFEVFGNDDYVSPTINTFSSDGIKQVKYYLDNEYQLTINLSSKANRIILDTNATEVYIEPTDVAITSITGDFFRFSLGQHYMKVESDGISSSTIEYSEGWL